MHATSTGVIPFAARTPPRPTPMQDLLRVLGASEAPATAEPATPLLQLRVPAGGTLVHEGARVEFVHVVRSGSFKCVRVLEDGYEQVLNFADRGDVLGFDGLCRGVQLTSAVALEDSTVYALPLRELAALRTQSAALDAALQLALSRQLASAARTAETMAAVASETRLARFLVWFSDRMAERGESPRRLRLRMSRRDIASLLGVAHETVSRSFTVLARAGLLRVDNREVEIVDAAGLRACTRSTRGHGDEIAARTPRAGAEAIAA